MVTTRTNILQASRDIWLTLLWTQLIFIRISENPHAACFWQGLQVIQERLARFPISTSANTPTQQQRLPLRPSSPHHSPTPHTPSHDHPHTPTHPPLHQRHTHSPPWALAPPNQNPLSALSPLPPPTHPQGRPVVLSVCRCGRVRPTRAPCGRHCHSLSGGGHRHAGRPNTQATAAAAAA